MQDEYTWEFDDELRKIGIYEQDERLWYKGKAYVIPSNQKELI